MIEWRRSIERRQSLCRSPMCLLSDSQSKEEMVYTFVYNQVQHHKIVCCGKCTRLGWWRLWNSISLWGLFRMRKIMARLSVFRCPLLTIPYKTYSDTSYFTHKLLNFEKELHYQNLIKIQAKTPRFIAGILEFHFLKDELHWTRFTETEKCCIALYIFT